METMVNTGELGRLDEPSAVRSLELGGVRFSFVVDGSIGMVKEKFFPAIPPEHWSAHPDTIDARGRVVMAAGGLLVERDGRALLLDAGFGAVTGEEKVGDQVIAYVDNGSLPDTLAALGRSPSDIDTVAFTHLHVDHTGWAFVPDETGGRRPFFDKARYLVAAPEWAPHERGVDIPGAPSREAVIEPMAGHHTAFDDGDEIFPGVHALVTPGHTHGHTSYIVTTEAGRLIMFGDAFHVPAQIQHPDWPSLPDVDTTAVLAARARLISELQQPDTIGVGCHFGDQVFGRVDGTPAWTPVPAPAKLPTPRPLTT